jgi:hypothetical protein
MILEYSNFDPIMRPPQLSGLYEKKELRREKTQIQREKPKVPIKFPRLLSDNSLQPTFYA